MRGESNEIDVRILDRLEHDSGGEVPGLVEVVLEERSEGELAENDVVGGMEHAVARGEGREVEERRYQNHRRRRRRWLPREQPLPHRTSLLGFQISIQRVSESERNATTQG